MPEPYASGPTRTGNPDRPARRQVRRTAAIAASPMLSSAAPHPMVKAVVRWRDRRPSSERCVRTTKGRLCVARTAMMTLR
jgi:hypothetical protein